MPINDFYSRIGFAGTKVEAPAQKARVASEDEGDFMRGLANIPGQLENIYGAGKVLTGLVATKLGAQDTGKELIKSGMERMSSGEAKQVVKESDEFLKAWEKVSALSLLTGCRTRSVLALATLLRPWRSWGLAARQLTRPALLQV